MTSVLVTSAGTASAINVIKALRLQQEHAVRLVAVDADETAPGLYLADAREIVPRCSHPDYIPTLLRLCERHRIRALFPIYSAEIAVVADHADQFGRCGIGLLLAKPDTLRLCNDKRRMYGVVAALGISAPRTLDDESGIRFPLFAKPNTASGTEGAGQINDATDWAYFKAKHPDFVFQEFVHGKEYTVDILCDAASHLVVCSPRLRLATKAGQSVKGRTVSEPRLTDLCARICQAIGMVGPCNIQFIQREEEFVFIEMNPRYAAGGLMLTVHAGANTPLLVLRLMLGENVVPPTVRSGITMLRYWEETFIAAETK